MNLFCVNVENRLADLIDNCFVLVVEEILDISVCVCKKLVLCRAVELVLVEVSLSCLQILTWS